VVGPERRSRVERATKAWSEKLMDLSRRNRLFHYKALKAGSLTLRVDATQALDQLLAGKKVPVVELAAVAEGRTPDAQLKQVRTIARKAMENEEERGLSTLFVVVDHLVWTAEDGKETASPLALLPVAAEVEGKAGRSATLQAKGEVVVNPVLVHALARGYGIAAPAESEDDELMARLGVLRQWADAASARIPGSRRGPHLSLDNLSFQKMAMVQELVDQVDTLAAHDLIASMAGDPDAAASLTAHRSPPVDFDVLDTISPDDEFLVLDADSSQVRIAVEANRGNSGVIHGPPGTGKSQTITNLIASLVARGKRVLFVAEKRAALDVVKRRLDGAGLGHCVLDMHGADVSRRAIAQQLSQAIAAITSTPPVDPTTTHRLYVQKRDTLRGRMQRLHAVNGLTGESLHDTMGKLLAAQRSHQVAKVRWRGAGLHRLDADRVEHVVQQLSNIHGAHRIVRDDEESLWMRARSEADGQAILSALDGLETLEARLPALQAEASRVAAACGVAEPMTLDVMSRLLDAAATTQNALQPWKDQVMQMPLDEAVKELSAVGRGFWATAFAFVFRSTFRAAHRALREAHVVPASLQALWKAASHLSASLQQWKAIAPRALPARDTGLLEPLRQRIREVKAALAPIDKVLQEGWRRRPLDEVASLAGLLLKDRGIARKIPAARKVRAELLALDCERFLDETVREDIAPERWPASFLGAWRASVLEEAQFESGLFDVERAVLDQTVETFRKSDRDRLELARHRVRRAHAEHAVAAYNRDPSGHQLLQRECAKKSRHLSFRTLLDRASVAVTATCPCVLASPLSVSQLLPARSDLFDVVIFDEASQVLPEDAVPALLRARQAIVAGDPKQLPPTTFFASAESDTGEEESALDGIESVLDALLPVLPSWKLEWHYRSRDERLIAFANRHIYGDSLVTFPSARVAPPISFQLAPMVAAVGQEDSSSSEVQLVVQAVLDHARERPEKSLGVITMGVPHRNRLQMALDDAVHRHPELQGFFDVQRDERFFIKNLEQVQGDERDVIFLSIGYGKDASGQLPFRFGPLLMHGGERRLNVAVTRSREQMRVFASFSDLDMDENKIRSDGVRMLRDFLAFARSEARLLGREGAAAFQLNAFEEDVKLALEARGVRLVSQLGVSRYRLDFAVQAPDQPGHYLLAIECDGASYHSAPTARDRDRLRQQQLESLGWRIHRIWSTDWFNHRAREVEACLRAIARAADEATTLPEFFLPPRAQPRQHVIPDATPTPRPPSPGATPRPRSTPSLPPATPRPELPPRTWKSIDEVPRAVLLSVVEWATSDGLLRTDDQIVQIVMPELGFERSGARIRAAILDAVAATRRS
jgi:very-short-patch-repair endonuclease